MSNTNEPAEENPPTQMTAEQIDEWVRFTMRSYMKPHLQEVYRSILDDFPKPAPADFVPRRVR